MGGEILAESVEGEGSQFRLRLPLPADTTKPEIAKTEGHNVSETPPNTLSRGTEARPLDILLAEDTEINRFIVRRFLKGTSYRLTEAVDGLEAVEIASARAFDVILMDIAMPRLDGVEATRQIRARGASAGARILALTAHALPEELVKFRAAGMESCLTKPITRDQLLAALASVEPGKAVL